MTGHRYTSAEDARFLGAAVDAIWAHVEKSPWRSMEQRDRFHAELIRARAIYQQIEDRSQPAR